MVWDEPTAYLWCLFGLLFIGSLLPLRIEDRRDHIVFTIVAAATFGILGPRALVLAWGAVLLATPVVFGWGLLARRKTGAGYGDAIAAVAWLWLSAFAATVGFLLANFLYSDLFNRSYPMQPSNATGFLVAGLVVTVWAVGLEAVRILFIHSDMRSFRNYGLDPFDSVLLPYLLPLMGGFPLVAASVALYQPAEPWPSLMILWWCFPLYGATAFDLHRRRLAQDLRRDVIAQQRLAAIGEVSARIVHQSRHQVGLMGWSIHRLRGLVGVNSAEAAAAVERELDALADAKDHLSEMLTTELLHEAADDVNTGTGSTRPPSTLRELVDDVHDQLQGEAEREGVTLSIEAAPGAGDRSVPGALRDVVFNLVDNAIDAASTQVTVHLDRRDGHDVVRVCDDGSGLAAGDAERMFEPFFTTKGDGTGMGLAIADALVGDLGGDLRHERSDGKTTFAVTLPPS